MRQSTRSSHVGLLGVLLSCVWGLVFAQTTFNVDDIKGPVCIVRDTVAGVSYTLSPEQSLYNVVVTDGYAHLRLTQKFVNRFGVAGSIVYVLPLPDAGSVHAMAMEYQGKVYRARIYERQTAQHLYDSVTASGGNAALLVQERPNVFQQYLANIAPGESAYVRIEVSMPLKYNQGFYELSIPTMVGQRYQSQGATPVPSSGTLWNPPEDRDGPSLQINVLLQTGFPITDISSPTHPLDIGDLSQTRTILEQRGVVEKEWRADMACNRSVLLPEVNTYPNRDYVLRFRRTAKDQDFTFASHLNPVYGKGHFALNLFPDDTLFAGNRPNLEIVLLIDVSGSQSGWPLQKEKEVALNMLNRLLPTDRISLLAFSDDVYWGFGDQNPRSATAANLATARSFVNGLQTLGGTQLLNGVKAALSATTTSEHLRYFVFFTDGFITDETAILDQIKNDPSTPTIFTFGAGGSLNRYFLEQCASVGNGYATEITQLEDAAPLVDAAWSKIEAPQLKNVTVDLGGAAVSDIIMPHGTVLYKGSPLTVYGTYAEGGRFLVTATGTRGLQTVTISREVDFASVMNTNFMMPQIWAKQKIEQLALAEGTTTAKRDSITAISVEYQVLGKYTAFLAIDPEMVQQGESIQDQMSSSFTESRPRKLTARVSTRSVVCRDGFLSLTLPTGVYAEEISVFDMNGRLVFRFRPSAGMQMNSFRWDGLPANGMKLRPGRYIVRVRTTAGNVLTQSVSWVR